MEFMESKGWLATHLELSYLFRDVRRRRNTRLLLILRVGRGGLCKRVFDDFGGGQRKGAGLGMVKLLAFWYRACCRMCGDGNDVPERLRTDVEKVQAVEIEETASPLRPDGIMTLFLEMCRRP